MDKQFEARFHDTFEEKYWWERARREAIKKLLPEMKGKKVFDLGCASGVLLTELQAMGADVYGVDISLSAVALCRQKSLKHVYIANASRIPFKDSMFDVTISSDVLEHVDDDKSAAKEALRVTKQGGILIIFVPAFKCLWGAQDDVSHHKRRYNKKSLEALFSPNVKFIKLSYWNSLLFVPLYVYRKYMAITKNNKANFEQLNYSFIHKIFSMILSLENMLVKSTFSFPFGVSVFMLARKR